MEYLLSFAAGLVPALFSDRLRLLDVLEPDELLDDEPDRLEPEELLPVPLDELSVDEPREAFLPFLSGDLPLERRLDRPGLGVSEAAL